MTIPEETREAMWMALNHAIEDYGLTGERIDHFEAALAWLDAQAAAPERWQPVEDMPPVSCGGLEDELGDWNVDVSTAENLLIMETNVSLPDAPKPLRVHLAAELPDNLRLCRRMEVQP